MEGGQPRVDGSVLELFKLWRPRIRTQGFCVKFSNMAMIDTPGQRLRAFRKERGLSGQTLAEAVGCTKSTVSYWESGRSALPWTACLALEAAYGVSARWLTEGDGPMWVTPGKQRPRPRKDSYSIPLVTPELAFDAAGRPVDPHPDAPSIGFPTSLLEEIGGGRLPSVEALRLWRVQDEAMAPALPKGSWVLLDSSPQLAEGLKDHAVYLVRMEPGGIPCLRRVARMPSRGKVEDGSLLFGVDAPGHLPICLKETQVILEAMLLARALWAGISLT